MCEDMREMKNLNHHTLYTREGCREYEALTEEMRAQALVIQGEGSFPFFLVKYASTRGRKKRIKNFHDTG